MIPSRNDIEQELRLRRLVDFIPAVSPKYTAPLHLLPLLEKFELAIQGIPQRVCCSAPPRHGKAVSDDTLMMTSRGWVQARHIVTGDELVGSNGDWTRVTGVFPQGVTQLWRVSFSDGAELLTCGEHRWLVHQRYGYEPTVRSTNYLKADLYESDGRAKWRVPMAQPMLGIDVDLPVDPYLLGAWLGDGSSTKAEITTMDPEIIGAFETAGFPRSYSVNSLASTTNDSKATTYGLLGGFFVKLKLLGVIGNKHIPDAYLRSPASSRLALLQGLADTDGTVAKNGSSQSICTTKPALASGIKTLVSSLGGTWTSYLRTPKRGKIADTISFRLPAGMEGFRLQRKQSRLAPHGPRNIPRRFIKTIVPAGTGSATCFEVAADDHLFCAGRDFVVTHNTESVLHTIPYGLRLRPELRFSYSTYADRLSRSKSRKARHLANECGIQIDSTALNEWRTPEGGGLLAGGVGGPLTGHGVDILLVDDPIKNRIEAESAAFSERLIDWWRDVAATRIEPGGSAFVFMTRWTPDDLVGQLVNEGFQYINLPAINPDGTSLWPERWPVSALETRRAEVGEYTWASLYQGEPRPRGGRIFNDVYTYEKEPVNYRSSFGLDVAYTSKTSSDYSAVVKMKLLNGHYYIVDAYRAQISPPHLRAKLKSLHESEPHARWLWHASGTELGTVAFFQESIPLRAVKPDGDKFTRSINFATAWNAGKVLVPRKAPWLDVFLGEIASFTGVNDAHDDLVDAATSAFEALRSSENVIVQKEIPEVKATGLKGLMI